MTVSLNTLICLLLCQELLDYAFEYLSGDPQFNLDQQIQSINLWAKLVISQFINKKVIKYKQKEKNHQTFCLLEA